VFEGRWESGCLEVHWCADHVAGSSCYCYSCRLDDCFYVAVVQIGAVAGGLFQIDFGCHILALALKIRQRMEGKCILDELTLSGGLLSEHWCHSSILRTWAHTWVHTIHWWLLMALLRALAHHHRSASSRTWIPIDSRHWMSITWRHEMALSSLGKHHLRAWSHALRGHKSVGRILHHNWWAHVCLLRNELVAL
jgi:hypothetical protein